MTRFPPNYNRELPKDEGGDENNRRDEELTVSRDDENYEMSISPPTLRDQQQENGLQDMPDLGITSSPQPGLSSSPMDEDELDDQSGDLTNNPPILTSVVSDSEQSTSTAYSSQQEDALNRLPTPPPTRSPFTQGGRLSKKRSQPTGTITPVTTPGASPFDMPDVYDEGGERLEAEAEGFHAWTIERWPEMLLAAMDNSKRHLGLLQPISGGVIVAACQQEDQGSAFLNTLQSTGRLCSPIFRLGGEHKWRLICSLAGNHPRGDPRDDLSITLQCVDEGMSTGQGSSSSLVTDNSGTLSSAPISVCAQFVIALVKARADDPDALNALINVSLNGKAIPPGTIIARCANHRFEPGDAAFTMNQFAAHTQASKMTVSTGVKKLVADAPGSVHGQSLTFLLRLRVFPDPTGVLWHSFVNYNSKRATGFVGIMNQGATCYMNSLLQSLFLLKAFRKAVYAIPSSEDDNPCDSAAYAIQRLFYRLQTSEAPVSTQELTRSFGWEGAEAFTQHDVQEFSRILLDAVEEAMKGTPVDGTIQRLFEGTVSNVVECTKVDFKSVRKETFSDLQLTAKGFKTLEESFDDYTKAEELTGDNQYMAEGHGKQDAKRYVAFDKFPPILHCQLVRYSFDWDTRAISKYNGKLAFPEHLDLSKYLAPDAPEEERARLNRYVLHSVLVHSGDVGSGHYFVYFRDHQTGQWYKFDDTRVTKCTSKEAIQDNWGYDPEDEKTEKLEVNKRQLRGVPQAAQSNLRSSPSGMVVHRRYTSAYMVVYVREEQLDMIQAPLQSTDIPIHIPRQIALERTAEERRKESQLALAQACAFSLVTPVDILKCYSERNVGYDLLPQQEDELEQFVDQGQLMVTHLRRDEPISKLRALAQERLGLSTTARVGLWFFAPRQNRTLRITSLQPRHNDHMPISSIFVDRRMLPTLFAADLLHGREQEIQGWSESKIEALCSSIERGFMFQDSKTQPGSALLWFKLCTKQVIQAQRETPANQINRLMYPSRLQCKPLDYLIIDQKESVQDALNRLAKIPGTPPGVQSYSLFEEVKPGRIEGVDPGKQIFNAGLRSGDILVLTKDPTIASPIQFYEDVQGLMMCNLVPAYPKSRQSDPGYVHRCRLNQRMSALAACQVLTLTALIATQNEQGLPADLLNRVRFWYFSPDGLGPQLQQVRQHPPLQLLLSSKSTCLVPVDSEPLSKFIKTGTSLYGPSTLMNSITLYYEYLTVELGDKLQLPATFIQWQGDEWPIYYPPTTALDIVVSSLLPLSAEFFADEEIMDNAPVEDTFTEIKPMSYFIVEIINRRIQSIHAHTLPTPPTPNKGFLRLIHAETQENLTSLSNVPQQESIIYKAPVILPAFQFNGDPLIAHSEPFLVPLMEGEPWSTTKDRIIEHILPAVDILQNSNKPRKQLTTSMSSSSFASDDGIGHGQDRLVDFIRLYRLEPSSAPTPALPTALSNFRLQGLSIKEVVPEIMDHECLVDKLHPLMSKMSDEQAITSPVPGSIFPFHIGVSRELPKSPLMSSSVQSVYEPHPNKPHIAPSHISTGGSIKIKQRKGASGTSSTQ